ncbi:MAG: hypothetical protein IH949_10580, partial [Bacteroidetes bacterium]|nr:hypothetical protein [Bacteroidota bacterium]
MNKFYILIALFVIVLFFDVFPKPSPLSASNINTSEVILFSPPLGIITVTSPNSGESWQSASSKVISWNDNLSENVKIELYKGGLFHSVISISTSSDGSKTWDIPDTTPAGTDYTVKITSVDSSNVFDFSDINFTIYPPVITVTAPNGNENWLIGSSYLITWTDNIFEKVELQLYKGGSFFTSITTSTASDGSYTWIILGGTIAGSDYKIRIASVTNSNIFDESDANFTLLSQIIVSSPNNSENWRTGSTQNITWTDNISENVMIELYKGGTLHSNIISSTPSTGSYIWIIPGGTATGSNYKIKITSVSDPNTFDFSNSDFTIFEGSITVTSPNGTESWNAGTTETITWTDNITENVMIDLYKGGSFHSIISTTTSSDGSKSWSIPFTLESGSDYKVKIISVNDPGISDFSNANFTVVGNQVTVTTPNGGESWPTGTSQIITWTDNLTGSVEIQLYKGGAFHSSITTSTPSDGTYTWNISNTLVQGSDYKIRISSVDDGIFDLSDGNFTIFNNNITVSLPNGGENWFAGSTQNITWTDDISGNVKIELYQAEVFNSTIVSSTPSDGSYLWNIPGGTATGSDYKVKITSIDQTALSDLSNSSFTIFTAQITVSSPDGGESWQAGTIQTITWTDNIIENVMIDLYKGGSFHSVISTSTSSDGSKTWTIPFALESGSDYKVKITSINDPGISDLSNTDFTIVGNQVTVITPNGGEDYLIGSSQIITWTDNLTGSVEIQLYKGGAFHSSITTSTASDGAYTWNISNSLIQGSDYKIRISSVDDDNIFDLSDANFTLSNEIIVTSPNGGENWLAGKLEFITWNDNIPDNNLVKIELYKGGSLNTVLFEAEDADGSKRWTIDPAITPGTDYRIKVISVDDNNVFDISDADFTISRSNITVTSPNGGESWQAGSSQSINWTDDFSENVLIELYKGGSFHSTIVATTASDGSKIWNIPFTLESGTDYSVKIAKVGDPNVFDFSDNNFTIVGNQVTVTTPNGGEDWQAGSSQIITWTDNLTGNVEIQLFKGGVFNSSIITSTASDGVFTWNIPGTTPAGSDYKVNIVSVDDGNVFDLSDANFTLSNELIVTIPNGGESWQAGTSHTINWTDNITGNVKIELYDNGSFDSEITPSSPSNGSFAWDIPVGIATGTKIKIKISSVDDASVFDFSDTDFEIFAGNITVITPNGGESWQAGTAKSITWTDNIAENITIDLYKGGTFHSIISTSTSSDGTRNWNIPFALESGNNYTVKITSVSDPGISDFSNSSFTIIGNQVTIITPNGGEDYLIGSSQIITWTDNLTGNVEIQLFKGGIFHSIITTSTASDGTYTWNIPGTTVADSDYRIRISSADDGNVFDLSDADFTLSHEIIVTVPNGGESWQAGTSHTISWTDNITGNVKIELYKGGTFDSEISPSTPSTGSYTWDIPVGSAAGLNYKVKISSIDNTSISDLSDNNFEIFEGIITVITPNGGESWVAGTTQTINWTDNITENITIDLYKGGTLHSIISTSTSSDGTRNWNIPFALESGSDYKVKITSVNDPGISDFSSSNFTIVGNQVTVTTPDGGEDWQVGSSQIINWTDNLTGNVEIQLFKSGIFHSSLTGSTPSDGAYTWNISNTLIQGSDYSIRISSVDDGNIFDFSDADFTLSNEIIVTTPNDTESWRAGTSHTINWTDNITGNVKIELYDNGSFDSEITPSTPG